MATARMALGAGGTTAATVGFSGTTPPVSALTEEFSETVTLKTVTDS